jgi:hypothetical protein
MNDADIPVLGPFFGGGGFVAVIGVARKERLS